MKLTKLACISMLGLCPSVFAVNLFQLDATVGTQSASYGFNTAQEAINAFQQQKLQQHFTYVGTEQVAVDLNYRGLGLILDYAAGSTSLNLNIPSLSISRTFSGGTRDQSQSLLYDFFKSGDILGQIMKKLAETSPVDPIAGNPNSLMSQMVASDYNSGFTSTVSNIAQQAGQAAGTPNLVGLGLRFGSFKQSDFKSNSVALPLSYTIRSDIDPRRQLIINIPLAQTDTQGAKSYYVGSGVTYRRPMNDNWTLAPSFQYAITGSADLGSVAQIVSGSLTSTYIINRDSYDIGIGNMVGYYKTLKFSSSGYSFDPGIKNTVLRNGAMLSMPLAALGRNMTIEYSLVDTRFTGSALYMKSYDELGITIGTNKSATSARSYLRGGISYLHSAQSKGFTANFGYWF